jgi:hypothetical protein
VCLQGTAIIGCCLPFAVAAMCLQGAAILVYCGFPFAVRCVLLRVGVSSELVTLSEGLLFWVELLTVHSRSKGFLTDLWV